jgi:ABC-type glutathione transport system ATPase component
MLEARGLTVIYQGPPRFVAVKSVDLLIGSGDTVGLVGESGSGKSTLARALVGLSPVTDGGVHLDERRILGPGHRIRSVADLGIQLVFQDPHASLNPRMSLGETLNEAVSLKQRGRAAVRARTLELVDMVGLSPDHLVRYPHQISGGQLQRIAIARALAVQPKFLLLDEVTASLDVSVQARILNLLRRLQRDLGFAMLYISHDLSVIRYVSDHVYVMRHGEIVEQGPVDQIFDQPRIDYTQQLLRSVPTLGGNRWRRLTTPSHQEST